jgi:hypothetical protein
LLIASMLLQAMRQTPTKTIMRQPLGDITNTQATPLTARGIPSIRKRRGHYADPCVSRQSKRRRTGPS